MIIVYVSKFVQNITQSYFINWHNKRKGFRNLSIQNGIDVNREGEEMSMMTLNFALVS